MIRVIAIDATRGKSHTSTNLTGCVTKGGAGINPCCFMETRSGRFPRGGGFVTNAIGGTLALIREGGPAALALAGFGPPAKRIAGEMLRQLPFKRRKTVRSIQFMSRRKNFRRKFRGRRRRRR